ncbi:hypothetical protein TUMEXPCC7403_10450 [Tumidithrix helvetica PCC 7403]|uniref:hybrid sensor histidine kinase/response regulator n=1 Tax=Tumidithrix helvetica TaxID=3457545 RepID=UPI003C950360
MISPAAVLNSPPIKVLLVEDDRIDRLAFTRSAKQASWPYDYTIATSLTEAISIINTQVFEIAILDYNLGDGLSSSLFPILKAKNCPFIISTGSGDEETAAKLMNEGAYDYLIKDPDRNYLKVLPATVNKTLDRHRAEGQLLLLNHAMQSVKDCIYILNEQGELQFVNNTLAKLSNLTPQEAIGQPIQILKQPDLEEWISSNSCLILEGAVDGQIPMRRADGSSYLAFISESRIHEASSSIGVGVIRDITSLKQIELELRNARENLEQIVLERTDALRQENQERLQAEANLLQLNQTLEARVETRTQELQERESQLRDLFDNATDLIQSVAPDGRILFVNRAWKETLGYDDADLAQLSIFQVIHPDDLTHCQIAMQTLFAGSTSLNLETRFLTKDCREIVVEGNVNCQMQDGIPIATRGIFRDVTQRKLAEASLAESEAFNRQLVEEFPIGLASCGMDGQLTYVNSAFAHILGRTVEECLTLTYWDITPIKYADREAEQLLIIQTEGRYGPYEKEYIHKDGHLVPVLLTGIVILRNDELSIWSSVQDISDRKQAENALRESQQFLQTVLDTFPLSVFWKDRDSVYLGCNQQFVKTTGLQSPSEVIGKTDFDFPYTEAEVLAYRADDRQVIESGAARLGIEETITLPTGEQRWLETNKVPLRDLAGNAIGIVGTFQDISDRKQAEAELQRTNEELARATRLKDEFLANMSHELRTPLNAILGMAEGLQEGVFGNMNERQVKAIQTIESSGSHLLSLINDILDVAKIESGQIELDCTPTSVSLLCQSSLVFIKQQAMQKRIQLVTKLPPNLPDLLVDERRTRQVLINLLNNALKFTPEGGCITLEVTYKQQQKENFPLFEGEGLGERSFLRIAIIDTGIGISSENIKKLFQPFIQIDSALNRQYQGTGLGLALVKRIVELHGGQVGLTSEVGVGSCFSIELPCAVSGSSPSEPTPQSGDSGSEPSQPQLETSPLILLAEDNPANISTVSAYLQAKGYRMLLARNGLEAVELAKAHHPNLILMDIQMPEMDGIEAMQQIRLDPSLTNLPIVALTALAMANDRQKCLDAGANEYLTKPVRLKELATAIQHLLGHAI